MIDADVFRSGNAGGVDDELQAICESIVSVRLSFVRNIYARTLRFVRLRLPCLFRLFVREPVEYTCARLVNRRALGNVLNEKFDRIFVLRLYVHPIAALAEQYNPDATTWLDVDDIESITRSRIADLRRKNGDRCESASLEIEAAFFERLEKEVLPECERVFVTSQIDKTNLLERTGATNLSLLPNVYAPRSLLPPASGSTVFTFLFIGSYGYYPNHEAAVMLCRDVIPRLVDLSPTPISFRFVGAGAKPRLQKMIKNTKGAEFAGPVEHIDAAYAGINAVVAPINAGGGTRIKILEAFAFGKPVVSTHLGAEGIECEDGVHLLLATSADAFAGQCLRLVTSVKLRESIASAAAKLLRRKYCPEMLNICC